MRTINKAGLDLIRNFEGLRLKAYPDPGTGGDPWTIGYGHTGPDVKPGQVITNERADELLVNDLAKFERIVSDLCPNTTDNQFAALTSFCYNCGPKNLETSTLRRLHNEGKKFEAADNFLKWTKAAGKVLPGLVKRRTAERELYLS